MKEIVPTVGYVDDVEGKPYVIAATGENVAGVGEIGATFDEILFVREQSAGAHKKYVVPTLSQYAHTNEHVSSCWCLELTAESP
jgi:hypothetical protein